MAKAGTDNDWSFISIPPVRDRQVPDGAGSGPNPLMASELAKYDFGRTDVDAKGAAYQEIVGTNLRGDRGQYFTPRGAIKLVVSMLDPKPNERLLDPACGTGGFLTATVAHLAHRFQKEKGIEPGAESTQELSSIRERLGEFVKTNLFGADFDRFLVRATTMSLSMAAKANEPVNVFYMDSLAFPRGHLPGLEPAKAAIPLGSLDIVMTNPPFGSECRLAKARRSDGNRPTGRHSR